MTRQIVKRQMKGTSEAARLRLAAVAAEYVESLGRGLRFRREELGMSRSEVARKMPGKTNENAIYRWEGGQHKPNDAALEALARVLDVGHWTRFMDLDPARGSAPEEPVTAPTPFAPADSLAERLDEMNAMLAEHTRAVSLQNELLERQSLILERIEKRLGRDENVRDEIADLIRQRGREIVEGLPPASAPGQTPEPQRSSAAQKKRAAKPRTAPRPA